MPFESQKQARWMFWKHPKMAARWAEHTPSIKKLPEKVGVLNALRKRLRRGK